MKDVPFDKKVGVTVFEMEKKSCMKEIAVTEVKIVRGSARDI